MGARNSYAVGDLINRRWVVVGTHTYGLNRSLVVEDLNWGGAKVAVFPCLRGVDPVSYTHLTLPTNREV